ncbi:AAA family ATPase [Sulfitobacter sp. 1A13730]|uniref:AAA family ATPase n=1 Tax=Sulfitobacter sp. 1A13730 TaxID=3368569 RepID=UPI0037469400
MKILSVFTSKGGSGKSTIAIHMAVIASQQKRRNRVLMLDYDVQESSRFWARARQEDNPPLLPADPGTLNGYLKQAREEGIDLVVIDLPPHSATQSGLALEKSDLVAIPVRPGAFDLWAMEATAEAVEEAGAKGAFILNQVPSRGTEADETEQVLRAKIPQIPVVKARLGLRKPFSSALNAGLAVTEFAGPKEKASQEAVALFREIKGLLK